MLEARPTSIAFLPIKASSQQTIWVGSRTTLGALASGPSARPLCEKPPLWTETLQPASNSSALLNTGRLMRTPPPPRLPIGGPLSTIPCSMSGRPQGLIRFWRVMKRADMTAVSWACEAASKDSPISMKLMKPKQTGTPYLRIIVGLTTSEEEFSVQIGPVLLNRETITCLALWNLETQSPPKMMTALTQALSSKAM